MGVELPGSAAPAAELLPLIVEVPLAQAPLTSGMYQRVTAGFAAAGWPEESIIASMSILETFIFGAAVDSPGPNDVYAPYDPANAPQMGRVYEAFARSVRERQTRAHDLVFTMGLDAALIGLHHIWGQGGAGQGAVAGAAAVSVWHCGLGARFS